MGAQLTKGEATVDGKAAADKANGQVRIYHKHFYDRGILSIWFFSPFMIQQLVFNNLILEFVLHFLIIRQQSPQFWRKIF